MKKKLSLIAVLLSFNSLFCQEVFKTMFYNVLNFPLQEPATQRLNNLETILLDYQPDLFMICELNNSSGATSILNMMQQAINPNYQMANFVLNGSDDTIGNQNDLQNLIYFDSTKFSLESQTEVNTIFRDFNHYVLKLNTVNQASNPIEINIIVCHLKASSGTDNQQLRLQMAQDLTSYLDGFSSTDYFLLGGDLNIYTNSEPAFQELIDTNNNITFIDPADRMGSWHNNSNYLDVFTQSTRTTTSLGGSNGGFDDRFDFIMTSDNLQNNPELKYTPNSYQVWGNNGVTSCYNSAINSNDCSGSLFNTTIREALHNFSDHLPVTLQIETNESFLSLDTFQVSQSIFEIIGSNIVNSKIELKITKPLPFTTNLNIYNTLGQVMKNTPLNSETILIDISFLSEGIYYISLPKINVQPLKFVKVN